MLRAIAMFFYNGISFRTDILDQIISKLVELREIVKEVGFFIFLMICRVIGDSGHQVFLLLMRVMEIIRLTCI